MAKPKLKKGDVVEILQPSEIVKTLDSNGTLDNLPFMAEMIQFCGKKFRISARIEKTCVECRKSDILITEETREFLTNDIVSLENVRCSGSAHDGCQTGCLIFWKEAWLKKTDDKSDDLYPSEQDEEQLRSKLKARGFNDKYFCQSTQLPSSTKFISMQGRFVKLCKEIVEGNIKMESAIKSVIYSPVRRFNPAYLIKGQLKKTPAESLNLQAGEWVEVKSYDEILKTLDENGRNRGLTFIYGMKEYCGKKIRVRNRLDRMMNEATGEMLEPKNSVILEDVICNYEYRFLGCPRQRFHIWREIWLKRIVS